MNVNQIFTIQLLTKKIFKKIFMFYLLILCIVRRCDSIQGTDYIANPFFLNLRVSRTKIENIRGQVVQILFG